MKTYFHFFEDIQARREAAAQATRERLEIQKQAALDRLAAQAEKREEMISNTLERQKKERARKEKEIQARIDRENLKAEIQQEVGSN